MSTPPLQQKPWSGATQNWSVGLVGAGRVFAQHVADLGLTSSILSPQE